MWDKDDHLSRWVQGIIGAFLLLIVLVEVGSLFYSASFGLWSAIRYGTTIFGAGYLAWRCLKYAITGRDCINHEDYK